MKLVYVHNIYGGVPGALSVKVKVNHTVYMDSIHSFTSDRIKTKSLTYFVSVHRSMWVYLRLWVLFTRHPGNFT